MSDDTKPNLPPDRDSQSDSQSDFQKRPGFWLRVLIWAKRPSTIAILVSLLALGTGGTVWAYVFITQKLAPLVSEQISTIVNREVELGQVERFSLSGIRFGRSQMPPTDTDPDRLSIQAVEVGFNILPLLFKRTLPLSITLEELDVYIEQDDSGAWLDLNITTSGKPLPVEIPTTIKIPDAEIVLLATGKKIPLSVNLDLTAELSEKFKRAKYDLEAGIKTGKIPPTPLVKGGDSRDIPPTPLVKGGYYGNIAVKGETFLETGKSKVNARIDNFALTDLNPIIPQLPVTLENGFLAANLNIELPSFTELPTVLGTLGFREIQVSGSQLPEKFLANGLLRFQGKTVKLEDIQGSVGAIAAEVSGQVDLDRGFDVAVDINPFALTSLLELAQVEAPVFLDGDMAVNLQVTGPLQNPQVAGTVGTIRNTRIDAIAFTDIRAEFSANLQQFTLTDLRILPLAGGEIYGRGEAKLNQASPKDTELAFDFGVQLPVDRIAAPYNLPPELAIGNLSATASIRGTADNPKANLNWRLPAAEVTVPNPNNPLAIALSGSGEAIFSDKIVRLRNTLLKLGDGSITLAGSGNLETKKWQASIAAASFTLDPFLPVPIKVAIKDANANAAGSLDKPDPKAIAASGQIGLNVEGGTVRGVGRLDDGNVEASATLSQIELSQLGVPVPLTLLAGNVKLSGNLDTLDSAVISANLGLKVADGLVDLSGEVKSGFVNAAVNTSAINLATIAPQLPLTVTLLDSQVNLAASIDSLIAAATSAGANPQKLPTAESLTGIDVNADVRLAVAEGLVNANAQLNSGLINASVNTTEIDIEQIASNLPLPVILLASKVNVNASLASLINAANQAIQGQLTPENLPTLVTGIDVNADVRLAVADGLVNAKTQLSSGVVNASVNTTEINLANIASNLPIPVRLFGSQINANASLASLINAANSSLEAIARNQLPTADSLTGIDVNADVRLGVADGLVNAKTQLSSGVVNASVNTTEINLEQIASNLPLPVRLLGSQINATASLASLINAANSSLEAIARNQLPTAESLTGIDVNADVRLGVADGLVNAKTQLSSGVVNASVSTTEIDLEKVSPNLPLPVRLLASKVNANASLASLVAAANQAIQGQLTPENLPTLVTGIDVNADVRLGVADGLVNAKTQLSSGVVNASVNTTEIDLEKVSSNLPLPVRLLASKVNANASLASLVAAANNSVEAIARNQLPTAGSLTGIDINADVRLGVADGLINANAQLNSGEVKVRGNAGEINLTAIAQNFSQNLPVPIAVKAMQFNLATSLDSLLSLPQTQDFNSIDANANLDLVVANGRVNAQGRLSSGLLSARANTSENIYIPELSPQLPIPVTLFESAVNISTEVNPLISAARNASGGSIQELSQELSLNTLQAVQINGNVDLAIADGRVNAQATVKKNQWETAIDAADIQLLEFAAFFPAGFLSPETQQLSPNKFRLNAQANLAGDLAPLLSLGAEPLAIEAKNLSVQLGEQSLAANGSIGLTNLITNPDIYKLELDLVADSNLETLPVNLPPEIIAKGQVHLDGRLEGKNLISDPLAPGNVKFTGNLRLANVAVNQWELDPMLAGSVNVESGQEVAIALKGKRDILAAQLEACTRDDCLVPYLPVSLNVQLGVAGENPIIATGERKGDRFNLNLEKFSLTAFKLSPGVEYGIPGMVGGDISANVGVNLFTLDAAGNLRIIQPSIGYIKAEEFATTFAYTGGVGQVPQGYLKLGRSQYEFEGGVNLNTRQINGKITTKTAYVEDILTTFSWYSFQDLARNIQSPNIDSANLETQPRGLPNETLLTQLRRFAEINARLRQNAEIAMSPAPPTLADVRGAYQADITIAGTLENPNVKLNVEANNLEWRTKPPFTEVTEEGLVLAENQIIPIDRVIIQGNFESGFLTVQPMRIEFGDTLISFVGKLGKESNTGKFEMKKLSLDTVRNFVDIPGIKLDGNINANAVLAGNLENPQIRGDISLTEGQINDESVEEVFGSFSLSNQRLLFATTQPSSLQVFGSVPVPPTQGENDLVSVNLNIGTEAIELLGLLTQRQVEWISGEGEVKISARGNIDLEEKTLKNLQATGAMTFKDATLKTATLDEVLEINGAITFDQERIRVDQFAGVFADSILTVQGVLPLLDPLTPDDPDINYPMTISLNEGEINLETLYKGKVGGRVTISGAAFRPIIGGAIRLEDGTAFVPKRDETQGTSFAVEEEPPIVPILDNFQISLGEKFTLENWPLFKFRILGDLIVNGSLYDLRPDGIIRLVRGEINLFSSQFYVTRNYDQMVSFSPEWGLDPELNIQLGTVVLEKSDRQRLPDSESEILDPLVFSSRPDQINVRLTIKGRSTELLAALDSNSQLLDLVELTSTPSRNESEIVSLLGREFLATIEDIQRLPGDLQDRSSRQLLELAINSFILKPYLQELQFAVEDVVTKGGRKIGLEDLRLYPTFEGIYQLDEQSVLGVSYDYTYQQFEIQYQMRF